MDDLLKRQAQSEMLVNRLKKNRRRLVPWAEKENLTCYRLYDRDIPEIPLAVDWYDGRLHVALYERSDSDADKQTAWTGYMAQEAAASLKVPADSVYIKFRKRAAGGTQYRPLDAKGRLIEVREAGLIFLVNLTDYVDTGLFLDHRILRRMVMQSAKGKRVLNLFAYTGAFSVYAAAGGARSVTTADLSNTYLDWAKKNMSRNGFSGSAYCYIRDDILGALTTDRLDGMYDLVILDPPTVSKSKAMNRDLDIQRDHPLLLRAVLKRVAPGGTVFFSSNLKKFKLSSEAAAGATIENISEKTRPYDFRSPFVHHSFRMVKNN